MASEKKKEELRRVTRSGANVFCAEAHSLSAALRELGEAGYIVRQLFQVNRGAGRDYAGDVYIVVEPKET